MRTTGFSIFSGTLLLFSALLLSGCNYNDKPTVVTYTVSGTVTGLAAGQSVTLYNNDNAAGDRLTLGANGNFTFAGRITDGGKYGVTVATHPAPDYCAVANSSGFVMSANVTNVRIVCAGPRTVVINGTVQAAEGGAMLAGVPVDALYAANGAVIASATTNAGGAFSIGVNENQDFYLRARGDNYGGTTYLTTNLEIQNELADRSLKMYMPDITKVGALSSLVGADITRDAMFGLDVKDSNDNGVPGVTVAVAPTISRILYNIGGGQLGAGPTTTASDSPSVVGLISSPDAARVGTYTVTLSGNTGNITIGNPLKLRLVPGEISQPIEP